MDKHLTSPGHLQLRHLTGKEKPGGTEIPYRKPVPG